MRAQMKKGTQLCIIISLLIIGACVNKPDTFSMDIGAGPKNLDNVLSSKSA